VRGEMGTTLRGYPDLWVRAALSGLLGNGSWGRPRANSGNGEWEPCLDAWLGVEPARLLELCRVAGRGLELDLSLFDLADWTLLTEALSSWSEVGGVPRESVDGPGEGVLGVGGLHESTGDRLVSPVVLIIRCR
jgi:hypothetical protein